MFDRVELKAAVARHGRVARVVIAGHEGSSPRETGTAMLVWQEGQSGTIGGGALEWLAAQRARAMLSQGGRRLDREALGPNIGQCCGGAVTLLTEVYDISLVDALPEDVVARTIDGREMPLAVQHLLKRQRAGDAPVKSQLVQGWMVEPVTQRQNPVWIWGAGHVGRAILNVLEPFPIFALTWVDTDRDRFPQVIPAGVTPVWSGNPALLAAHAPTEAMHVIVTYSHALDLELCHQLLVRGSKFLGVIGSATKAARFRSRLKALGHLPQDIAKMACPIGDRGLGKHPQAIALGVAVQLIKLQQQSETEIADDIRENRAVAFGGADQGLSGRNRQ